MGTAAPPAPSVLPDLIENLPDLIEKVWDAAMDQRRAIKVLLRR